MRITKLGIFLAVLVTLAIVARLSPGHTPTNPQLSSQPAPILSASPTLSN